MKAGNLFTDIPAHLPDELMETLAIGNGDVRIERIVSKGHRSAPGFWYDQDQHEWVVLLKGAAALRFEEGDRLLHLREGAHVHIAAHQKHRVEWTSDDTETIWLAVFYGGPPNP
jgi:cupin 2 domain-containing protein